MWESRLIEFVVERQNDDGGFTICKPLTSTLADSYYAISILTSLHCDVPMMERVAKFLESRIGKDVNALFYTLNSLHILGLSHPDFSDFLIERAERIAHRNRTISGDIGTTFSYSFEEPSALREAFMISNLLKLHGLEIPEYLKAFVIKFRRETEYGTGFGVRKANLKDTYYASYVVRDGKVAEFVRHFRCGGGFSKRPGGYPPYVEDTYYALSILDFLGCKIEKDGIAEYLLSLQNPDGGFRRSIYGGISTLENSYYVVESLKILRYPLRTR